jgi:rubrerythrin
MKKATKRWLRAMIKDEKEASKTYKQYGFPELAKDEARHKRVLTKRLKKIY